MFPAGGHINFLNMRSWEVGFVEPQSGSIFQWFSVN